jgi:hypothetical protein
MSHHHESSLRHLVSDLRQFAQHVESQGYHDGSTLRKSCALYWEPLRERVLRRVAAREPTDAGERLECGSLALHVLEELYMVMEAMCGGGGGGGQAAASGGGSAQPPCSSRACKRRQRSASPESPRAGAPTGAKRSRGSLQPAASAAAAGVITIDDDDDDMMVGTVRPPAATERSRLRAEQDAEYERALAADRLAAAQKLERETAQLERFSAHARELVASVRAAAGEAQSLRAQTVAVQADAFTTRIGRELAADVLSLIDQVQHLGVDVERIYPEVEVKLAQARQYAQSLMLKREQKQEQQPHAAPPLSSKAHIDAVRMYTTILSAHRRVSGYLEEMRAKLGKAQSQNRRLLADARVARFQN